jgi:hypothetical protein
MSGEKKIPEERGYLGEVKLPLSIVFREGRVVANARD